MTDLAQFVYLTAMRLHYELPVQKEVFTDIDKGCAARIIAMGLASTELLPNSYYGFINIRGGENTHIIGGRSKEKDDKTSIDEFVNGYNGYAIAIAGRRGTRIGCVKCDKELKVVKGDPVGIKVISFNVGNYIFSSVVCEDPSHVEFIKKQMRLLFNIVPVPAAPSAPAAPVEEKKRVIVPIEMD